MILENSLIQQAIEGNTEVIDSLQKEHFLDHINIHIFKIASKLTTQSYDAVRTAVNADDSIRGFGKGPIHDRINEVEKEVYGYSPRMIEEQKEEWQKSVFKRYGEKLLKVGTDLCTLDNAREYVGEMTDIVNKSVSTQEFTEFEELASKFQDIEPEGLEEERLKIKHSVLRAIFSDYLKKRLYVLGGFPSMGKNIIADILTNDIMHYGGCYFSFDNTVRETALSVASIGSGVYYQRIEDGNMTKFEKERYAKRAIVNNKLFITQRKMTARQIRAAVAKYVKEKGIKFFVVDYFTKIKLPYATDATRQLEEAIDILADTCHDLGVTGIVLSQLNSEGEAKRCKSVFEEAYYFVRIDGERSSDERRVVIEKNKKGQLDTIRIRIQHHVGDIVLL